MGNVRDPAVAGFFYPRTETLSTDVAGYLSVTKQCLVTFAKALIAPHARRAVRQIAAEAMPPGAMMPTKSVGLSSSVRPTALHFKGCGAARRRLQDTARRSYDRRCDTDSHCQAASSHSWTTNRIAKNIR